MKADADCRELMREWEVRTQKGRETVVRSKELDYLGSGSSFATYYLTYLDIICLHLISLICMIDPGRHHLGRVMERVCRGYLTSYTFSLAASGTKRTLIAPWVLFLKLLQMRGCPTGIWSHACGLGSQESAFSSREALWRGNTCFPTHFHVLI